MLDIIDYFPPSSVISERSAAGEPSHCRGTNHLSGSTLPHLFYFYFFRLFFFSILFAFILQTDLNSFMTCAALLKRPVETNWFSSSFPDVPGCWLAEPLLKTDHNFLPHRFCWNVLRFLSIFRTFSEAPALYKGQNKAQEVLLDVVVVFSQQQFVFLTLNKNYRN